jgi:hypothetical protein
MVLSKGHDVVGPGYSRLSGDVARVTDRGEESGNSNRVCQEYDTDRGQIGLLETAGVTGKDTQVIRQIGLLRTAGVTRTTTRVSRQSGLLRRARVTRMVTRVYRQIGLLGSAGVTETATQSCEILAGLWKIWLTRKVGLQKIRLLWKAE